MLTPSPYGSSEDDETEQNQSQICQRPDLQLYSFRWVEFDESIRRSFQQLREKRMFNDVTISCENSEVAAHKIVLATSSDFFSRLLQRSSFRSNPHPIIFIKDVKMKHLKFILDFMYTGEVKVPRNDTTPVLQAAEELEIKAFKTDDFRDRNKTSMKAFQTDDLDDHNSVEIVIRKRRATEFSSSSTLSSPEKRSRSNSWSSIPSSSRGSSPILFQPKINLNESSFFQENAEEGSQEKDTENRQENIEDGSQEKDKENRQESTEDGSQEKDQENAEDGCQEKDQKNIEVGSQEKDTENIEVGSKEKDTENIEIGSKVKDKENIQDNTENGSLEKDKENRQYNIEDGSQEKDKENIEDGSLEKDKDYRHVNIEDGSQERDKENIEDGSLEKDKESRKENAEDDSLEPSEVCNAVTPAKTASTTPSSDEKIDRETKRAALIEKVGSGMFKCKQCEYTSKAVFNVKKHVEVHLSPCKYKCLLCPSVVKNEFYFKAHMKAKHGIKLKTVNAEDEKLKICQEDIEENDNDRLENVNQSVVESSQRSNAETLLEYKCNLCQSVLKNEVYFKAHMKTRHSITLKTVCWLKKE